MKYPTKANINERGLFFGFVSENIPKREFPFELSEVEITEENFNQIKVIQNLQGAPVLIDGVFVNKKEEITNFVLSPNQSIRK
jgi:hypothetical protein